MKGKLSIVSKNALSCCRMFKVTNPKEYIEHPFMRSSAAFATDVNIDLTS